MFIQFIWVHTLLTRENGVIETNPGPKPNPCHSFSMSLEPKWANCT